LSAHINKVIIAKEEHNTYKQQTKEGKLMYKMNIIYKKITCCITLQCLRTNHTDINYVIKDSFKLNYLDLGIDV